ncbi:MAG: hypothetical protein WCF43_03325 [Steroidobacteraceae bacterium]
MSEFAVIADEILGTTLTAHGFVCVAREPDLAMYESAACTLAVGHDSKRSSEVFIGLNRREAACGPDFGFDEVIRASSVPASLHPTGYAARGEESVRQLLEAMAKLLATYCVPLLRGDEGAWSHLVTQRDAEAARYATENHLRLALNGATEAWKGKKFAKVVELLDPVRTMLGTADRARLEYAERKLRDA